MIKNYNQIQSGFSKNPQCRVFCLPHAGEMIEKLEKKDAKIAKNIRKTITRIQKNPKIGKVLHANLANLQSLASRDKKIRVVFHYSNYYHRVLIWAVGPRKSVYSKLDLYLKEIENNPKLQEQIKLQVGAAV